MSRFASPRRAGLAVALVALVLAACSKNNSVPNPGPSVTSTPTPTATITGTVGVTPGAAGIAYIPDSGVASFQGVQVVHVEDTSGNLLPTPFPMTVPFASSVGEFVSSPDGTVALAVLKNTTTGGYTLVQSVANVANGTIIPVGTTYDASMLPTPSPIPSVAPGATATPTATPVPSPLPVISDVTGLSVLGSGSNSVGLLLGPSNQGFLGMTSLADAPPQYGGFVPFQGSTQPVTLPMSPRTNIQALLDANGAYSALVRGPSDLAAFTVSLVGTGFQFTATADDTSLGYGGTSNLRGYGAFAIDPADSTRAIVARTTAGGASTITLVTGLPSAITHSSSILLPSTVNTVQFTPTGTYALVGAADGFYVIGGASSGTLSVTAVSPVNFVSPNDATAYAVPFVACNGSQQRLTNVTSIGMTNDEKYVIALGSVPGVTCASGANSTVVAVPFSITTGVIATPSPAPTASGSATTPPSSFAQNNVLTPPTGADVMLVH